MNKYVYGSLVIAMVAVLGMGAVFATGPNGFGNGFMKSDLTDEEKLVMRENQETMRAAVEAEDYATWEALMLEKVGFMEDRITQENFDEIVLRHAERSEFRLAVDELKALDDFSREAMQELKTQYGIEDKGFGKMHGGSEKGMRGPGSREGSCPFAE